MLSVFNYYIKCDRSSSTVFDLVDPPNNDLLLMGDSNAKDRPWGVNNISDAKGGKIIEKLQLDTNLVLLNDGSPTFHRGGSSIDLAFCNSQLASSCEFDTFPNWSVEGKFDHYPIIVNTNNFLNQGTHNEPPVIRHK